ncbi:MAG TPA: hypothetical protein VGL15_14965 [Vicinamibacteria bacterium]
MTRARAAAGLIVLVPIALAGPVRARTGPRAFVAAPTAIEGPLAEQPLPGFEKTTRTIRRAPQGSGRIEFDAPPPGLRGGEDYAVGIYFVNQGKRPVTLRDLRFGLNESGRRSSGRVPPRTVTVKRGERALLHEVRGRWPAAARTWALRVKLTAASGDTYTSQLAWK